MRTTIGLLLLAGVALAPRIASSQLVACRADRERFCADVPLGGGRVLKCLEAHSSSLSDGCKQALGSMAPAGGSAPAAGGTSARQACHEDAEKFCRDAAGDRAQMKACLQAHAGELSNGCKSALAAMKRG